ncbi:MAG: preprotein translocase subunit YajC [Ignavibacteria bacterium]
MINLIMFLQSDGGMGGLVSSLLPFILIILVFYFLILRPQQKRQKNRQKLLDSVKKGDKIISAGGIHGTVEGIDDKTVLVKISENTKVKMERSSITTILGVTPEEKK